MFIIKVYFLCFLQLLHTSKNRKWSICCISNSDKNNSINYPLYEEKELLGCILFEFCEFMLFEIKEKYLKIKKQESFNDKPSCIDFCEIVHEIINKILLNHNQKNIITEETEKAWKNYIQERYICFENNKRIKIQNDSYAIENIFNKLCDVTTTVRRIHSDDIIVDLRIIIISFGWFLKDEYPENYCLLLDFCVKLKFRNDRTIKCGESFNLIYDMIFKTSKNLFTIENFTRELICEKIYNFAKYKNTLNYIVVCILIDADWLIYKNYFEFLKEYKYDDDLMDKKVLDIICQIFNQNPQKTNYLKLLNKYINDNTTQIKILVVYQFHLDDIELYGKFKRHKKNVFFAKDTCEKSKNIYKLLLPKLKQLTEGITIILNARFIVKENEKNENKGLVIKK